MNEGMWTATAMSPEKVMAKATLIGRKHGWAFYEHPVYGEDEPLLAVRPGCPVYNTHEFEVPDAI